MVKKIILISFLLGLNSSQDMAFAAAKKSAAEDSSTSESPSSDKEGEAEVSGQKKLEELQRIQSDADNYYYKNSVFKLAPFSIPVFSSQSVVSTVQIEASMQTTDEEWDKIRLKIPILYHHLFVDLYHSLNFLWDRLNPPTSEVLKKRFIDVANRVLGEGKIKKVFIILIAVADG
jgi:hypothetical protein